MALITLLKAASYDVSSTAMMVMMVVMMVMMVMTVMVMMVMMMMVMIHIHTLALDTMIPLSWSKSGKTPAWLPGSLTMDWRLKRERDLQK